MEVHNSYMSYGQNLVHGEGTSLSRVGPYRFCGDANPRTLSILLWSYLILSDTHMIEDWKVCQFDARRGIKLGRKKHKTRWQFLLVTWPLWDGENVTVFQRSTKSPLTQPMRKLPPKRPQEKRGYRCLSLLGLTWKNLENYWTKQGSLRIIGPSYGGVWPCYRRVLGSPNHQLWDPMILRVIARSLYTSFVCFSFVKWTKKRSFFHMFLVWWLNAMFHLYMSPSFRGYPGNCGQQNTSKCSNQGERTLAFRVCGVVLWSYELDLLHNFGGEA